MEVEQLLERMKKEGTRRRFSPMTIETYQQIVSRFIRHCNKSIMEISKHDKD